MMMQRPNPVGTPITRLRCSSSHDCSSSVGVDEGEREGEEAIRESNNINA